MPEFVNCTSCGKEFERKRSPLKGYKVTSQHGVVCDGCYGSMFTTTVLEFGCGDPCHGGYDGEQRAVDQMWIANKLWNALVDIDRFERTEYRRLTADPYVASRITEKEAEKETLFASLRTKRMKERTKRVQDPETKQRLDALRAELKTLYGVQKELAVSMRTTNAEAIKALATDVKTKVDEAVKVSGLHWTMSQHVLAKFKIATSRAKKSGSVLKFKRFDGTGVIVIPYSNGLALEETHRSDDVGKFQISISKMSDHPREKRTLCRVAVTTEEKKPVWLSLPVVFHRPIPEGADIRQVTVRRDLDTGRPRWKMCITIRTEAKKPTTNSKSVGLDIGWRKRPDESIRVAYWVDEDNNHGELTIPAGDVEQFRKLADLRSIMDSHFNEAKVEVAQILKTLSDVPETVSQAFAYVGQWRSPGKLVRAHRTLKDNRFAGDEKLWDALQYWYYGKYPKPSEWNGHLHLYLWWKNLSDQMDRRRRERYRVFAADLAKKYGTIRMEEFDIRDVAELPEVDQPAAAQYDSVSRYQRRVAAVSTLRQIIETTAKREGCQFSKEDSKWSTHMCPTCGSFINFDAAADLLCKCDNCGSVHDQDYVGGYNILHRTAAASV